MDVPTVSTSFEGMTHSYIVHPDPVCWIFNQHSLDEIRLVVAPVGRDQGSIISADIPQTHSWVLTASKRSIGFSTLKGSFPVSIQYSVTPVVSVIHC
jgi:hypothetical protein